MPLRGFNPNTMERVKVTITQSFSDCRAKEGDKGYIHDYIRNKNGYPFAIVISNKNIDALPLYAIDVIQEPVNED